MRDRIKLVKYPIVPKLIAIVDDLKKKRKEMKVAEVAVKNLFSASSRNTICGINVLDLGGILNSMLCEMGGSLSALDEAIKVIEVGLLDY